MPDPIHDVPAGLERLRAVMARLRDPEAGCPWDLAQDFTSIAPYTIEEAYEVADAIARGDMAALKDELGDLLLQPVYHARMAEESGAFDLDDVIEAITTKMIARHPHVFADGARPRSAEAQGTAWEAMKSGERGGAAGTLDGVAYGLPALLRAAKLQRRAARVGFDWPVTDQVLEKIVEEAEELAAARSGRPGGTVAEELGDLLFSLVNLARHLDVDPEAALRAANAKFERRFGRIDTELRHRGSSPAESSLEEMDAIWAETKRDGG